MRICVVVLMFLIGSDFAWGQAPAGSCSLCGDDAGDGDVS